MDKDNIGNDICKDSGWTTAGLIDDLFLRLCTSSSWVNYNNNGQTREIKVSKYYMQAWELLPLISAGNPPPYYIINLSDLRPDLVHELQSDHENRDFVISQSIGRIFENISPRQYHLSIAKRLRWKLQP
jgi:hypothetical protein